MGNQIQTVANKSSLEAYLSNKDIQSSLAQMLPKHLTIERLTKVVLIAFSKTPKLYQCDIKSVLRAVMTSAELGLDCSGTMGQAYLVPYKDQCTLIPGYQGLLELVYRASRVKFIDAQVVYSNDKFVYRLGTNPLLEHQPALGKDRGEILCVYAVAELEGSSKPKIEIMAIDQINAIRDRSKAGRNGPWVTDFSEMARKTVLRRIIKTLPKSAEMEPLRRAIAIDNEQYDARPVASVTVDAKPSASGTKFVEDLLTDPDKAKAQEPAVEPTMADHGMEADQSEEYTNLGDFPDIPGELANAQDPDDGKTGLRFRYTCNAESCGVGFDKAAVEGKGGQAVAVCPKCKGKNITDTMPA